MARWILLLVAMVAFGVAFRIDSPGLLAATLLVGLVALLGGFAGFVAARVGGVAAGQSSREIELLMTARKRRENANDGGVSSYHGTAATARGGDRDGDAGGDGGADGGGSDGGGGSSGGSGD